MITLLHQKLTPICSWLATWIQNSLQILSSPIQYNCKNANISDLMKIGGVCHSQTSERPFNFLCVTLIFGFIFSLSSSFLRWSAATWSKRSSFAAVYSKRFLYIFTGTKHLYRHGNRIRMCASHCLFPIISWELWRCYNCRHNIDVTYSSTSSRVPSISVVMETQ